MPMPGEHDDVAKAGQHRERVAAVPRVQVEHPGEQRHHRSDRTPARDRTPKGAKVSALAEKSEQDQDGEQHPRDRLDAVG